MCGSKEEKKILWKKVKFIESRVQEYGYKLEVTCVLSVVKEQV